MRTTFEEWKNSGEFVESLIQAECLETCDEDGEGIVFISTCDDGTQFESWMEYGDYGFCVTVSNFSEVYSDFNEACEVLWELWGKHDYC